MKKSELRKIIREAINEVDQLNEKQYFCWCRCEAGGKTWNFKRGKIQSNGGCDCSNLEGELQDMADDGATGNDQFDGVSCDPSSVRPGGIGPHGIGLTPGDSILKDPFDDDPIINKDIEPF